MERESVKYFFCKNTYSLGLCCLLFLSSCKNSGPDIITSSGTQTKTAIHYGVITINKSVLLDDGSLSSPACELSALFSASPLIADNVIGATSQDVGNVKINELLLTRTLKDGISYYESSSSKFMPPPYLCSISGADNVKPFSYKVEGNFPDYLGYSLLPDTIDSKSALVITLADITNSDEVEVYITDRVTPTSVKHVSSPIKSVSFTQHDLSHLAAPSNAIIVVTCYKTFYETFNGKKYKFRLGYKVEKYNVNII